MARGPQVIAQPGGSVTIAYSATANSIQTAINANPGATTFWIEKGGGTGIRSQLAAIVPKTGNTFVFEFGAILDGGGWVTADRTQASFRAHNENIDNVTIENATIRNMPQRGIHAYKDFSSGWIVRNCEIHDCFTGFEFPSNATIERNIIHDCIGNPLATLPANRGGAYGCNKGVNVTFDDNEVYACGPEQKWVEGSGHVVTNNYYHDTYVGPWFDGDNTNLLIEDNTITDIDNEGIDIEISEQAIIRGNTITRAETGIFIATSKGNEIYDNDIVDCWRAINLFVNFAVVGGPPAGPIYPWDLSDNHVHDNRIVMGTRAGSITSLLSVSGGTTTQRQPYLDNTKNNLWIDNSYTVPATGSWWQWMGLAKTWVQWQALPQDAAGMEFPGGSPSGSPGGGGGGTIDTGSTTALFFSGFGDSDGIFTAVDGTILAVSPLVKIGARWAGSHTVPSNPDSPDYDGKSGCNNLIGLDNGTLAFTGTIFAAAENYTSTGVLDLETDTVLGSHGSDNQFAAYYISTNGTYAYAFCNIGGSERLFKIDNNGDVVSNWNIGSYDPFDRVMVVDMTETFAYMLEGTEIIQIDLGDNSTTSILDGSPKIPACLRMLRNGELLVAWDDETVDRIDTSGTTLQSYTFPGAAALDFMRWSLQTGVDDTSFWMIAYDDGAPPKYGVRVFNVRVSDGAILHSFQPEYIAPTGGPGVFQAGFGGYSFEWDGPMAVVTLGSEPVVVDPPPGTVPPPVITNSTPCCGHDETTGPNPGPIPPGIGWIPQCLGGGLTPTAVALVDSENWDV